MNVIADSFISPKHGKKDIDPQYHKERNNIYLTLALIFENKTFWSYCIWQEQKRLEYVSFLYTYHKRGFT
jgi:hypothetical protein